MFKRDDMAGRNDTRGRAIVGCLLFLALAASPLRALLPDPGGSTCADPAPIGDPCAAGDLTAHPADFDRGTQTGFSVQHTYPWITFEAVWFQFVLPPGKQFTFTGDAESEFGMDAYLTCKDPPAAFQPVDWTTLHGGQVSVANWDSSPKSVHFVFSSSNLTPNAYFSVACDDYVLPAVQFQVATSAQSEGDSPSVERTFWVSLSGEPLADATVDWAITGGTAKSTDYSPYLGDGQMRIPAHSTGPFPITISVNGEGYYDINRTVLLTLTNPANLVLGSRTAHTHTIQNDDALPRFIPQSASALESAGTLDVPIVAQIVPGGGTELAISYTYETSSQTANGIDIGEFPPPFGEPPDFYNKAGSFTLLPPAPYSITSVPVFLLDDTTDPVYEGNETLDFIITDRNGSLRSAVQTILEDEDTPIISVQTPLSFTEQDVDVEYAISLLMSPKADVPISVDYQAVGGVLLAFPQATVNDDFLPLEGTATFGVRQSTIPLTLTIVGDDLYEETETMRVFLSNAASPAGVYKARSFTILDDDDPFDFSLDSLQVDAGTLVRLDPNLQNGYADLDSSWRITSVAGTAGTLHETTSLTPIYRDSSAGSGQTTIQATIHDTENEYADPVTKSTSITVHSWEDFPEYSPLSNINGDAGANQGAIPKGITLIETASTGSGDGRRVFWTERDAAGVVSLREWYQGERRQIAMGEELLGAAQDEDEVLLLTATPEQVNVRTSALPNGGWGTCVPIPDSAGFDGAASILKYQGRWIAAVDNGESLAPPPNGEGRFCTPPAPMVTILPRRRGRPLRNSAFKYVSSGV